VDLVVGPDGTPRCWWCGDDPTYVAYHDDDWGQPIHDDRELFELLCLEGFQAGLSWITILRKRAAFRAAFDGFAPEVVAAYDEPDIERLLADAGIVRHRGKIEATIANARAVLALDGSLDDLVWSYTSTGARPASRADIPGFTPDATALSKDLKRRGFRFVGPTTVYAFMQSAGIVDDHLEGCWRANP
jgi:DNA-3-methyladenine glycosylase I